MFTYAELSALHVSPVDNGPEDGAKDHNIPQQAVFFGNRNRGYQQNAVYRPMYEQQQQQQQQHQQSFDNIVINGGLPPVWKIGDKCLAPWSDGQVCTLSYTLMVMILRCSYIGKVV